ncbi:MAG: hypothetical protein HKN92_02070 [Chitinophagales bacterium]|nr:hypothetical protein [Chitinophagales bacterium]
MSQKLTSDFHPSNNKLKYLREAIWWLVTVLSAYVILLPVTSAIHYTFYWFNVLIIFTFITYFRYSVFFKDILIFRNKWVKLIIFLLNIHLFVFILSNLQKFSVVMDSYEIESFANHLKDEISAGEEARLLKYLYREVFIIGIGSLVLVIALNIVIIVNFFTKRIKRIL